MTIDQTAGDQTAGDQTARHQTAGDRTAGDRTAGEATTATPGPAPSARLREFQTEVDSLKVAGGRANPERLWLKLGVAAWVLAIVIEVYAWASSHSSEDALEQRDFIIISIAGLAVALIGTGLFVTFTLTRYFRYWLIRLIYQDRESTDRLLDRLSDR